MRCTHTLTPLMPPASTDEERFARLFCGAASYLTCTGCGRVGWRTKFGRMSWLSAHDASKARAEAARHAPATDI